MRNNRRRDPEYQERYLENAITPDSDLTRKARQRDKVIRRLYGLSLEAVKAMYVGQKGLCALCHQPMAFDELRIDHSHKTGIVRGLLHNKCNIFLGYSGDSVERLVQAIEYLTQNF